MQSTFLGGRVALHCGDSRDVLKTLADNSIDSIVTDPPYALVSVVKRFGNGKSENEDYAMSKSIPGYMSRGFMGKRWDNGEVAHDVEFWSECLRVLKPGGHVVAFSGTRTYHRMACAIEDAGFEIRDQLQWLYGSGFPKSHDVSKGIDKAAGVEREIVGEDKYAARRPNGRAGNEVYHGDNRTEWMLTAPATPAAIQWQGWGTALKPANEPIVLARKPLSEKTVAANVLVHGTGAINVGGCRVGDGKDRSSGGLDGKKSDATIAMGGSWSGERFARPTGGRWPANVLHDGSDEVMAAFPDSNHSGGMRCRNSSGSELGQSSGWNKHDNRATNSREYGESGSAARFFYTAKADSDDRLGSKHPTVKPVDLMQWLCRLVTPKGGTVLDPFAGTGTTGEAAYYEGFNAVLIEAEAEYQIDIRRRMALVLAGPDERMRESAKARMGDQPMDFGPLFDWMCNVPCD